MRAALTGSIALLTLLAAPGRADVLWGVAGTPTTGVAVGQGQILFSNTIHQFWDLAQGADSTLRYTAVVAVNTGFVACAENGSIWVSSTPTGTAFVQRAQPVSVALRGLAVIADRVVAVGDDGTILVSQDIGFATWQAQDSGTSEDLYAVAGNGNTSVAVGANGAIVKGGALATGWQTVEVAETRDFYGITRGPTLLYLAVGEGGAMWRGLGDGVTWSNISGLTLADLRGTVTIGSPAGQSAVVVGDSGTIFYSPGAFTNWTQADSGVSANLNAVAFCGNDLVAVGRDSTTLWSQIGLEWNLTIVPVDETSWGRLKNRYATVR